MTVATTGCDSQSHGLRVRTSGLPSAGQWRSGFAVGDLDGDGKLDVLHGPPRQAPGLPRLWSWVGDRFVETPVAWPAAKFDYGAAAIGDFDGDGDNDAAFAMHTLGVRIVLRDGTRFADAGLVPFSSRALVAAQLDDDPALELAALADGPTAGEASSETGIAIIDLDAAGAAGHRVIDASRGLLGDTIVSADLDGDGFADLACGSSVRGFKRLTYMRRGERFEAREVPVGPQEVVRAVAALPRRGRAELVFGVWPPGIASPSRLLRWSPESGDAVWSSTAHRLTALAARGDDLIALTADGDAVTFTGSELRPGNVLRVSQGCAGQQLHAVDLGTKEHSTLVATFGSERSAECKNLGAMVLLAAP